MDFRTGAILRKLDDNEAGYHRVRSPLIDRAEEIITGDLMALKADLGVFRLCVQFFDDADGTGVSMEVTIKEGEESIDLADSAFSQAKTEAAEHFLGLISEMAVHLQWNGLEITV